MEGSHALSSSPSLLCHEDQSCINEDHEDSQLNLPGYELQYEDDYIRILIQKETETSPSSSNNQSSWLRDSRNDAVKWILHTQALMELRNQTAYLSVSYLDRFLSIRCIDEGKSWAIRLLSVACLSLAAKMEECKVPTLADYPVADYSFNCQVIEKMELLVLSTFKWKMGLVTPFNYLQFFIKKLVDHQRIKFDELISKSMDLLMGITQEISLIDYRPSVIAAAAVLAASDWQLTQETLKLRMSCVTLWETSDNQQHQEHIFSCYNIMQRLSAKGNISTPNMTEGNQTIGSTSTSCITGTKRRLEFDQDPNLPEKSRRG